MWKKGRLAAIALVLTASALATSAGLLAYRAVDVREIGRENPKRAEFHDFEISEIR